MLITHETLKQISRFKNKSRCSIKQIKEVAFMPQDLIYFKEKTSLKVYLIPSQAKQKGTNKTNKKGKEYQLTNQLKSCERRRKN